MTRATSEHTKIFSSFRDPSGSLFLKGGELFRAVNFSYRDHYDHVMNSGLYADLVKQHFLIPHEEVRDASLKLKNAYRIIKPQVIPFISYPYEWSFSQLKDAALCTLAIQKRAMSYGMTLKDASAYNVQFFHGKPILIDTLSFERYDVEKPWIAYRQFVEHFFAPLALMAYRDLRLNQMLRLFIDGIPLDLARKLLPFRTLFRFSILTHIHSHARFQNKYAENTKPVSLGRTSSRKTLGIIDNLETAIRKLPLPREKTEWGLYYESTNYTADALEDKRRIISDFLDIVEPKTAWDIGANTGYFSQIATSRKIFTVAFDVDPMAVEKNYRNSVKRGDHFMVPLVMDVVNPSPGIGWANRERLSVFERGKPDVVLCLALFHHLAISNNIPFEYIAELLSSLGTWLIIEFVPQDDSNAKRLMQWRSQDSFEFYTLENFISVFSRYYTVVQQVPIRASHRTLLLMRNHPAV